MKNPSVSNYFDAASKIYDEQTMTPDSWYTPVKFAKTLSSDERVYTSALVVGVGTGRDIPAIINHGIENISALDISEKMLALAKKHFPSIVTSHTDYLEFSENQKYDLIVCMGVLEFVGDLDAFFKKSSNLQNVGNTIYLTYEPNIENYEPQVSSTEILGIGGCFDEHDQGVRVYRHTIQSILSSAAVAGYKSILHDTFIAYTDVTASFQNFAVFEKIENR